MPHAASALGGSFVRAGWMRLDSHDHAAAITVNGRTAVLIAGGKKGTDETTAQ